MSPAIMQLANVSLVPMDSKRRMDSAMDALETVTHSMVSHASQGLTTASLATHLLSNAPNAHPLMAWIALLERVLSALATHTLLEQMSVKQDMPTVRFAIRTMATAPHAVLGMLSSILNAQHVQAIRTAQMD